MKLKKMLDEKAGSETTVITKEQFEEELKDSIGKLSNNVAKVVDDAFRSFKKNERFIEKQNDDQINEGKEGSDTLRISLLKRIFADVVSFEDANIGRRPAVIKIEKEKASNIIDFLLKNKESIKFKNVEGRKTKVKKKINEAIDKIFTNSNLKNIFQTTNKSLYNAIMDEFYKKLEEWVINDKSLFVAQTQKRISELDLTFLDNLKKGNLIFKPNEKGGKESFPDYIYKMTGETEKYKGEEQINNILKQVGVSPNPERVIIEMKGDNKSRVVSSETGSGTFLNSLSEDLVKKIKTLDNVGSSVGISLSELKEILNVVNLEKSFEYPIIFVKSARNEFSVLNLKIVSGAKFLLQRNKKSIGILIPVYTTKGGADKKIFTIELSTKAYNRIFGDNNA